MATCSAPLCFPGSSAGGRRRGTTQLNITPISISISNSPSSSLHMPCTKRTLTCVRAQHRNDTHTPTADFFAGFVVGGALFGTLAYIFAPQIRRSILNEDDYGFRRARNPIYYDQGLERTRETLNEKISQLNSAIDNVSSRLRGGNNKTPTVPLEVDPELEATI